MLLAIELRLPQARSLKEKRALITPVVVGARQRFGVAAAEVDHQDLRQRSGIAMTAVSDSIHHLEEVLDTLERWVWSHGGIEVVQSRREWWDPDL